MRVIALIEDPAVARAILTHLGLWQPQALERASPAPARAWPEHANLASLTTLCPTSPEAALRGSLAPERGFACVIQASAGKMPHNAELRNARIPPEERS